MNKEKQLTILKQLNICLGNKDKEVIKVGSKLKGRFYTIGKDYCDEYFAVEEDEKNIYIVGMDENYTEELAMTEKMVIGEEEFEELLDFFKELQIKVVE